MVCVVVVSCREEFRNEKVSELLLLSLHLEELKARLTEWLMEYNFNRPHQSLAYLAPIQYIERGLAKIRRPVSLMWSASPPP
jgi:transposase InsO family protein